MTTGFGRRRERHETGERDSDEDETWRRDDRVQSMRHGSDLA
jgi:hypothetical protein